jgi:hypothetical protein
MIMDEVIRRLGELSILKVEELKEVLALPAVDKRRLITAGYADFSLQQLVLFRGDGTSVIAPFGMFEPSGTTAPDFNELEIIDYGHTVRLGSYEASTRSILTDLDPEYKEYIRSIRRTNIN